MGLLNPYLWVALLAILAVSNGITFWQTWSWRDDAHQQEMLIASIKVEEKVRAEEMALRNKVILIERQNVNALRDQVVIATEQIAEAKNALRKIPACPIRRDIIRVLQPSSSTVPVPVDPAPTATPSGASAGVGAVPGDETIDVAVLLDTCKRNYERVCIPNKLHVLGLQAYVREACVRD